MSTKSILIMLLLAVALVGVGTFFNDSGDSTSAAAPSAGELLFPDLYDQINLVSELVVTNTDNEFHVELKDDEWTLMESANYPIQVEKVRSILITLAELKTVERKTDKPDRYSQLGVQAIGADPGAEAQSKLLTLNDAGGKAVATLIIGKPRSGGQGGTFYVRKPADSASWLVEGTVLDLPATGEDWLDKKVLEVTRADVRAVRITHGDGESLVISKTDADTNYTVHDMPSDRELTYEGVAGGIAGALQYLNFLSVSKADTFKTPEEHTSITSTWTKDGLRITTQLWELDEKVYGTFQAAYDLEGAPSLEVGPVAEGEPVIEAAATPRPKAEVEAEIVALNKRLAPWVYELPPYTKSNLAKRIGELLKPLPDPAAASEEEDLDLPLSIDSFGGALEDTTVGEEDQE
ncbi:MAG: hypothetical protein ACI8X5_003416 [Planctomycetota bacterium]|jgi:hypothetical protein